MFSARTLTQTQHKPLPLLEKKKEKVWVELFPRCYKYRRERTSALQSEAWSVSANRWASRYSCSHTSSTGYLRVYSPVDQHTHSRNNMPKCPKCQKEVYFGKISPLSIHFPAGSFVLICMHFFFMHENISWLMESSDFSAQGSWLTSTWLQARIFDLNIRRIKY